MNIFARLFKRIRFKKTIKTDESVNVVDGMVKAKILYKELCKLAHPDRNPQKAEEAEKLMKLIVENRFNYAALLQLEKEVKDKLCSK
jgi:hypothetical protein